MSEIIARKQMEPVAYAAACGLNDTRREIVQAGTATLAAGTVTVTGAYSLTANSIVILTVRTVGGTAGFLSAPSASFTPGTSFVINSSSGTDTSVVSWMIINPRFHSAVTATSVSGDWRNPVVTSAVLTSANATDLASSLTLAAEIASKYATHIGDSLAHRAADATNTLANAAPVDLTSLVTFVNDVKAKFNAHLAVTYHYTVDAVNTVATANATDQTSANTLLNAIKSAFNAHISAAPNGASVKFTGP